MLPILLFILLALYLFLIAPRLWGRPDTTPLLDRHYAHRGLHDNGSDAPENSMPAFRKAVEAGYGIELDVQLTRDRIPVVFHDETLERVCGVQGNVRDYTFEQLQAFPLCASDERIPLFADVLKLVDGRVPLIVEIKIHESAPVVCAAADALLKDYKGVYCIESFHPFAVRWYMQNRPDVVRGQLSASFNKPGKREPFVQTLVHYLLTNVLCRPDFIAYDHRHKYNLSRLLCKALFRPLNVAWTIRSQEELDMSASDFQLFIFEGFRPKAEAASIMDFEEIIRDISALNVNLYDFALYTSEGIKTHRFQPCSNCLNSYSVAKAFIVTALGFLWDDGKIRMDDPISQYLDLPPDADPRWQRATIEHAVTHQLGFDAGFLDIDTEDTTLYPEGDYLSMVLRHPLAYEPGSHEQYSDAAYYLLSRLISKAAGENADTLLNRRLIRPLQFHEIAWSRCPLEYPIGATGLYISAEDMVKLPALYMQGGVWQGKQILSRDWVDLVIANAYEFSPLTGAECTPSTLMGKGGMYGQMAAFSIKKGFAVAWHAHEEGEKCRLIRDYVCSL